MIADVFSGPNSSKALVSQLEGDFDNVINYLSREIKNIARVTSSDEYERLQKVGQGTFGEVFKARHKKSKQHCALKRIRMEQEREGFPITAIREIRILQSLQHENIVCLKDVCYTAHDENNAFAPQFFLVFEFCDHDLAGLSHKVEFPDSCKKSIMKQLLTGLYYLHKNHIIHRDLKAANILINKQGVLKIADFGLARNTIRPLHPDRQPRYTGRVVTLWYRPPEILLGDRHYGKPVDLWGAGCIMAELWTKYPIMQGDSEPAQLKLITNLCGSINSESWPGVERLESYNTFKLPKDIKRHVRERLKDKVNVPSAIDLIDRLLVIDPKRRLTAEDALMHDYFYEEPAPGDLRVFSREGFNHLEFFSSSRQAMQQPQQPAVPQMPQQHSVVGGGGHPMRGQGGGIAPHHHQAQMPPAPMQHVNPVSRQSRHHHYDQQQQQHQMGRRGGGGDVPYGGRPMPPVGRHHGTYHHPYMHPQQARSHYRHPPTQQQQQPPPQEDHIHERFY